MMLYCSFAVRVCTYGGTNINVNDKMTLKGHKYSFGGVKCEIFTVMTHAGPGEKRG
jgi:hypothetical protein